MKCVYCNRLVEERDGVLFDSISGSICPDVPGRPDAPHSLAQQGTGASVSTVRTIRPFDNDLGRTK